MLNFVKKVFGIHDDDKRSISDVLFDMMYFVDNKVPLLLNKVMTDDQLVTKVIVPFNYMLIPLALGARVIESSDKKSIKMLFGEYDISEKEMNQLMYLADKLQKLIAAEYHNNNNSPDDITNIPQHTKTVDLNAKIEIKKIPEYIFGENGMACNIMTAETVKGLVKSGKEIYSSIKKKCALIYGSSAVLIIAASAVGAYFFANGRNTVSENSDETNTSSTDENAIEAEYSDVEEVPYVEFTEV